MSKVSWVGVYCLFLLAACLPLETAQVQKELIINEYLLASPPDYSTEHLVFHFASGDQEAILAGTATYRDYQKQIEEYNNRLLTPLGYRQEDYQKEQFEGSGFFFGIPISTAGTKRLWMAPCSSAQYRSMPQAPISSAM